MITFAEFLHKYLVLFLWFLWIAFGALYYTIHDGYDYYVALYKAVSIGWSIGWDMPYETDVSDDAASMTYSCFHNCMGVMFTGMAIIIIAEKVVENTDDWMLEITRKTRIKSALEKTPGIKGKIIAFIRLNKTTVDLVVVCFLFGFCGVMLGVSLGHNTWTIRKSMDLTLSTLCTCGYLGLPVHALPWKYVIISIYTNCGVPFLNIGLGALITMFIVNPNEMELHKKISAPLIQAELEYMKSFGMENGDGFITRKEYTMLTIIRIGRVKATVIEQIRKQFQDLLEIHGEKKLLSYDDMQLVSNKSSFFSMSRIFPMRSVDSEEEESNHLKLVEEDIVDDSVSIDSGMAGGLVFPEGNSTSGSTSKIINNRSHSHSHSPSHNDNDNNIIDNNMDESKNLDEETQEQEQEQKDGDKDPDDDDDDEDGEDLFPCHTIKPTPHLLGDIKKKKTKTSISNESYRNLTQTTSTKLHLQKVKKHNHRILLHQNSDHFSLSRFKFIQIYIWTLLESRHVHVISAWVLWLVLAGLFYSLKMDISYMKGFYESVNVGYSIYWTANESDPVEKAFSVVHLLIGQVYMSILMAVVASNLIITKKVWYGEKQLQEQLQKQRQQDSLPQLIYHYMQYLISKHKVTLLFFFWLALGVAWSCLTVKWPLIQGVYFAITSLSLGGIWPIPENSEDSSYFFVAMYTAIGAPILLLNASMIAEYIAHLGNSYLVENVVYRAVKKKEIEYMQRVGMEDGSGQLDEQEYVLLTLVRLNALPHEIVSTIVEMFNLLDVNNSGNIPYADIINHKLSGGENSNFEKRRGSNCSDFDDIPEGSTKGMSSKTMSRSSSSNSHSPSKSQPSSVKVGLDFSSSVIEEEQEQQQEQQQHQISDVLAE